MVIPMLRRLARRDRVPDVISQALIGPEVIGQCEAVGELGPIGHVAVTLHPDALKALLLRQVSLSDLSQATKDKLCADLKALAPGAFTGVADRMLEAALLQARSELHLLQARVAA